MNFGQSLHPLRALDYLGRAEDFFEAFCDLPENYPPRSWPRYFMLCHAIELSLKAYLAAQGAIKRAWP
jgi:hypothetical protein